MRCLQLGLHFEDQRAEPAPGFQVLADFAFELFVFRAHFLPLTTVLLLVDFAIALKHILG